MKLSTKYQICCKIKILEKALKRIDSLLIDYKLNQIKKRLLEQDKITIEDIRCKSI